MNCNGLYLLRQANGQMHMYMIVSYVKIINKHNVFVVYRFKSARMILCWDLPYLSVLKPGSNTRRGSNIRWVVQQNERNKHLGPFKCRVPKLLNLINLKMVPNVKEN